MRGSQGRLFALPDQAYPTRKPKRLPLESMSKGKETVFHVPVALAILADPRGWVFDSRLVESGKLR